MSLTPQSSRSDPRRDAPDGLDTLYPVAPDQIAFFRENGYIKLKDVLSKQTLQYYGAEMTRLVLDLSRGHLPLEERSTYGKAFLQISNLWQRSGSEIVATFVRSRRLAQIAADLLEVGGVRLYHDQALYKEPGGGITPWHADQYYWPLSSDRAITVWVPLQHTPLAMGPLSFCAKSHRLDLERGLEISDESEARIQRKVISAGLAVEEGPFDLGEVSYHLGWTFHRAGRNTSDQPRGVMTVIYIDEHMRLASPTNRHQHSDWSRWMPGAEIGEIIDTPHNPVLFHR